MNIDSRTDQAAADAPALHFSTLYPLLNFLRIDLDFGESAITQRFKSLDFEGSREIHYSEIAFVEFQLYADARAINLGTMLALGAGMTVLVIRNPFTFIVGPYLLLAALGLCVFGFFKQEYCTFFDQDHEEVAQIRLTPGNFEEVYQAIDRVSSKTRIHSETGPDPENTIETPIHEVFIRYPAKFLSRQSIKFYETKVVFIEKSLTFDSVTELEYSDLGNKIEMIKMGDEYWSSLGWYPSILGFVLASLVYRFSHNPQTELYLALGGIILGIPCFLKGFVKNDFVFFYGNTRDNALLIAKIPHAQKQHFEEIIRFVKTKVSQTSPAD